MDTITWTGSQRDYAYIEWLVSSLKDPFSEFLSGKDLEQFSESLRGTFAGIGAVIGEHDEGVIIREILPESPAYKSGLKMGDIIVSVNGTSLRWKTTTEAVNLIRGEIGSRVTISYRRGGMLASSEITRQEVKIPSIKSETLSGGVLYIEIKMFGQSTARDFRQILATQANKDTKSIVIDLRDNGGGLLSAAQEMLSHFFPPQTVILRDKWKNTEEVIATELTQPLFLKTPVVVLVNENSASASEIFAGAMQDNKRWQVIGRKTYGKWSVQQPFQLSDGTTLKLTIARWFTPNNRSIDKEGITPDITLDPIPLSANADMIQDLLGQEKQKAVDLARKISN